MWIPIELILLIGVILFLGPIVDSLGDALLPLLLWLVVGVVVILPIGILVIARPEDAATIVFIGGSAGIVFLVWRAVRADRAWAAKRLKSLLTSHPPGVKAESSSATEEAPVRIMEASEIAEDGKSRWIG